MKALLKYGVVVVFAIALFFGCKKDGANNGPGTATMYVKMTDAPADYDAVYIDVKDVMITSSNNDEGWVSVGGVHAGVYDLLTFTNGLDTLIAGGVIVASDVAQIRLILGNNNSIVVDGETFPLKTPSAQQSGLKIKFNVDVIAGGVYFVMLDFDAGKSIVQNGAGDYHLKPVIRAFLENAHGAITGVLNPGVVTYVVATSGADTAGTYSTADGHFAIYGLVSGTYKLHINPDSITGVGMKVIENISVVDGQVTSLGTIDYP